jgi:hypothetical protein
VHERIYFLPSLISPINTWPPSFLAFQFQKNTSIKAVDITTPSACFASAGRLVDHPGVETGITNWRRRRMATMKLGSKPEIFVLEDLTWLSRFSRFLSVVYTSCLLSNYWDM